MTSLSIKRWTFLIRTFATAAGSSKPNALLTWLRFAACQWAASIRDFIVCETITGRGGWMDQLLVLDAPYIDGGFIRVNDKPGLGVELNPDVVKAHLAEGETWWG